MNHYEAVFILNPVLSETQTEEAVKKYESLLKTQKCKVVHKEDWGLKSLLTPFKTKTVAFTICFNLKAKVKLSTL